MRYNELCTPTSQNIIIPSCLREATHRPSRCVSRVFLCLGERRQSVCSGRTSKRIYKSHIAVYHRSFPSNKGLSAITYRIVARMGIRNKVRFASTRRQKKNPDDHVRARPNPMIVSNIHHARNWKCMTPRSVEKDDRRDGACIGN